MLDWHIFLSNQFSKHPKTQSFDLKVLPCLNSVKLLHTVSLSNRRLLYSNHVCGPISWKYPNESTLYFIVTTGVYDSSQNTLVYNRTPSLKIKWLRESSNLNTETVQVNDKLILKVRILCRHGSLKSDRKYWYSFTVISVFNGPTLKRKKRRKVDVYFLVSIGD